ncbi:uncharacterized protein LOC143010624 [Genypterus blacodes]|uniref:uncharacterized protein LOC143010624 n=1 Tax=Genypterus blacodes TaxID=154954 RepID=UPI003F76FBE6
MFHLRDKLLFVLSILLLTHCCEAQPQVIGPSQTIVATLGDIIILPCRLEPPVDAAAETIEWNRPDLNPRYVFVFRDGAELHSKTPPSYRGRTWLNVDGLKLGDVSLRLSGVQLSDEGTYRCFIPTLGRGANVDLVVRSVPSPITVGINKSRDGLTLECESAGWYPEPELLWLDAEGNIVSAGPTETLRGPDGLYTVINSVNVDSKHGNTFTCKLQHKYTNHTTAIYFHDHFFMAPPPAVQWCIDAVVVVVVVVLVVLVCVLVVWLVKERRRSGIAARRRHGGVENYLRRGQKSNEKISHDAEALGEVREGKLLLMGTWKVGELLKKEEELKSMRHAFMEQNKELENQRVKLNVQLEEEERHREQTERKIQPVASLILWSPQLKSYFLNEVKENLEWRKSELEKQQQNTEKLLRLIHEAVGSMPEGINAEEQEDQTNHQPSETQTGNEMTTAEAPVHPNKP